MTPLVSILTMLADEKRIEITYSRKKTQKSREFLLSGMALVRREG
jgi:hypothetical protein